MFAEHEKVRVMVSPVATYRIGSPPWPRPDPEPPKPEPWPWKLGTARPERGDSLFEREPWGITLTLLGEDTIEAEQPEGYMARFTWDAEAREWQGFWKRRHIRSKSPRNLLRWLERTEDKIREKATTGRPIYPGGPFHVSFDDGRSRTHAPEDDGRLDEAAASLGMGTRMLPSNRYQ